MPTDTLGAKVAEAFAWDLLDNPVLLAVFAATLRRRLDDPNLNGLLASTMIQAGYDPSTLEDLQAALTRLRAREVGYWRGIYTLYLDGGVGPRLAITRDGDVLLNGQPVRSFTYADDALTWESDPQTSSSAHLTFHDADPAGPQASPTITGTFKSGLAFVAVGRSNVFSVEAADGRSGDLPAYWAGTYDLRFTDGTNTPTTASLTLEAGTDPKDPAVSIDGVPIAGPIFTANQLSWSRQDHNPSGAVLTLTRDPITGVALCLGRYWTHVPEPLLRNFQGTRHPQQRLFSLTDATALAQWQGNYNLTFHAGTTADQPYLLSIGLATDVPQVQFGYKAVTGWTYDQNSLTLAWTAANNNPCAAQLAFSTTGGSKGCGGTITIGTVTDTDAYGQRQPDPPPPPQSTADTYGSGIAGAVVSGVVSAIVTGLITGVVAYLIARRSRDPNFRRELDVLKTRVEAEYSQLGKDAKSSIELVDLNTKGAAEQIKELKERVERNATIAEQVRQQTSNDLTQLLTQRAAEMKVQEQLRQQVQKQERALEEARQHGDRQVEELKKTLEATREQAQKADQAIRDHDTRMRSLQTELHELDKTVKSTHEQIKGLEAAKALHSAT